MKGGEGGLKKFAHEHKHDFNVPSNLNDKKIIILQ